MKTYFFQWLVIAVIAAGCKSRKETSDEGAAEYCHLHHKQLLSVTGYIPSEALMLEPTTEHTMFMSQFRERYPHATPLALKQEASESWNEKETVKVCPECDRTLNEDFDAYLKLDKEERERRWKAFLHSETKSHPLPDTHDEKGPESKSDFPFPP